MSERDEELQAAEERLVSAAADVDRLELTAKLCEQSGLAYASLTGDQLGPMLVTYQHTPIGEVHTTSPSAFQNWHAARYREDGSLGEEAGPYTTARAAAASMIPQNRTEPGPSKAG